METEDRLEKLASEKCGKPGHGRLGSLPADDESDNDGARGENIGPQVTFGYRQAVLTR